MNYSLMGRTPEFGDRSTPKLIDTIDGKTYRLHSATLASI